MKISIKDLKEKGETDDKIKFTGKVKDVYDPKEAVTKYSISRQNIIVDDGTASVKVIVSHKTKEDEYQKDIIGSEVEVDGKLSIWEGKKNIFGKLTFKGDEPKKTTTNVFNQAKSAITVLPPSTEIRKASLKLAIDFWTSRIGIEVEENKVLATARVFEKYIVGDKIIITRKKETTKKEEKEKAEIEKEGKEIAEEEKLSAEKITLINEVMSLKESNRLDTETFAEYCKGKDVKTLSIEELKELGKRLQEITSDIPF